VIALTEVHRVDDPAFLAVLDRLRWGKCGLTDYKYLQSLIGKRELDPDFTRLILVAGNVVRESLNAVLAAQHARQRESRILLSPAQDSSGSRPIVEPFKSELLAASESACGLRSSWLPLICGAVYVLKKNMSPELGLANSTRLVLRRILWENNPPMFEDDHLLPPLKLQNPPQILVFETLDSLLHKLDPEKYKRGARHKPIPGYAPGEIPITMSECDFQFTRAADIKKFGTKAKAPKHTLWRKQFPVLQAYASTIHGAQGLTLDQIVALLDSCTRYGSAYTMLTRTRTAAGNVILRDFEFKCLRKEPPIHVQTDWVRLQQLEEESLKIWNLVLPHSLQPSNYGTPVPERPASDLPPPKVAARRRKRRRGPPTAPTPLQEVQISPAVLSLPKETSFPIDVPLHRWDKKDLRSLLGLPARSATNLVNAGQGMADFYQQSQTHLHDTGLKFPASRPLILAFSDHLAKIAADQERRARVSDQLLLIQRAASRARLADLLAQQHCVPITATYAYVVRSQGDCGPDSLAFLSATPYVQANMRVWMSRRSALSTSLRNRVVGWMKDNGDTLVPGLGCPFNVMVSTTDWSLQCLKLKQKREYINPVFVAAAACVLKCNICVFTSDPTYPDGIIVYRPLLPTAKTMYLGHTDVPAHFVPLHPPT
jgi:hypothetical protein